MAKNKVISKTRRSNGEGSIFRRKNGTWTGYITVGKDENGKTIRKTVYGKNEMEVAKKLTEISGRLRNYAYDVIEKKSFGELMTDWLLVFKKSTVTTRTFEGIIRNFRLHIEPFIGNMKVYEIDTFTVQTVINKLIDNGYSMNSIKKNKHLISQFFEYAIDNNWVSKNPVNKVSVKAKERKVYSGQEQYKALTPEARMEFIEALKRDESNFLKPFCFVMLFAGLRVGEVCALQWRNIDLENKTMRVERGITQIAKFDNNGNVVERITVVGDTKTLCSVREIPIADIVVDVLKEWKEKQTLRQRTNKNVTAELVAPTSFVFANDDGSVRTYYGCRMIFDRFKRRNNLDKYNIHFHGLRHTFSNMLFEMNENPKVIQQLLGHRDVKTTITVYNSVDNEYIRSTTDKFNQKLKEEEIFLEKKEREEVLENRKEKFIADMTDEEYDDILQQLLEERKERKKRKEKDFEM